MGSALTTIGRDPIPATTDAVLIPADVQAYADSIDHKIIHWVADQNERDVFFAAASAPLFVASPSAFWIKISGSGGGSVWTTLAGDSGQLTTQLTAATDFEYVSGYARKIDNKFVIFACQFIRRNSSITLNAYNHATSPGNIVGDPAVFTFPAGFRPDAQVVGTWRSGTTNGAFRILTTGELGLYSGNPSTSIVQDDQIDISGCFVVA